LRGPARIGEHGGIPADLRQHVSSLLRDRLDPIADDAARGFARSKAEAIELEYAGQLARLLVGLLASAIGDERLDGRLSFIAHVQAQAAGRAMAAADLFAFVHLCERAALEELAVSAETGAATEAWPRVAQIVRSASFDVLAALTSDSARDASTGPLVDPGTALLSRRVFEIALAKEADRAGRFDDALALILVSVDRFDELNRQHGHGVAEKVVERLGVLIRGYFRRHDWIARAAVDSIAVLLTRADAEHAADLAEGVRATVAERLPFADHRSGEMVRVTVSAAVVAVPAAAGWSVDPERLFVETDAALVRARARGGNSVERIATLAVSRTLPRSSPSA
jgi:diguanylate cyclase (GGDEF)-like protein